jgi:hypothetical protein
MVRVRFVTVVRVWVWRRYRYIKVVLCCAVVSCLVLGAPLLPDDLSVEMSTTGFKKIQEWGKEKEKELASIL